jgi:hypothetical protein
MISRVTVKKLVVLLLEINLFLAAAQPLFSGDDIDFQNDVAPIFQQHCVECHHAEDPNGGLRLDVLTDLGTETDSGKPAIVSGKPDESELLRRISSQDENLRMPPEGAPLSSDEIQTLEAWILSGAESPMVTQESAAKSAEREASDHWSFRPIVEPNLPAVKDDSWARSPVDLFIQARRDAAGLRSVDDASPQQLLRRASYSLTGLPPSPAEVKAFLLDVSSGADIDQLFAEYVDDLLSRRDYGERWGRHWMDWIRYADTSGCNSDFPIPQAYLFRNYIIDAFNTDKPYDRFLTEQLAGDLLPANTLEQRNQQIIATGYLAMARRFGSLVETYPWHLTIEDTIDNVGRTMLGLTVACARCHDHKFDPISTRDYYGLYGIFESTRYPFPGIELFQVQHDFIPLVADEPLQEKLGEHSKKTRELEKQLQAELAKCRAKELDNAVKEPTASTEERRRLHDELQQMLLKARNAGNKLAKHLKDRPDFPAAYAVTEGQPSNARIQIKGEPSRPGATVPRKFLDVLGGERLQNTEHSGRLELAQWITSPDNPLTARVIVNRVWQRHFGRGLVASTSDFGIRGEEPSHPELLDWLAIDFMRHGWSLKHLHRRLLNSRVYRLSSSPETPSDNNAQSPNSSQQFVAMSDPGLHRNLASDPGNRYYWKFNRQRLDAESIRDSVLFVSGGLDRAPQTEAYPVPPQKDWAYTQHHPFKDEYPSDKRSVYQMTKRLTVGSYMQTFDGADPNVCTSKRDQSVTALQALYFMNDDSLHTHASRLAKRIIATEDEQLARVQATVYRVLSRPATDKESDILVEYVEQIAAEEGSELPAYASLIRSLFRLNEFVYVD